MLVIAAKPRPVGNMTVARGLPTIQRRAVGPFVFLDHMGPLSLAPGHGLDVAPHPHIGLSTVTYLIQGSSVHRDSLGSVVTIVPGDLNLMTAGNGVVHSERTDPAARAAGSAMHGLQLWLALPVVDELAGASFEHVSAINLPVVTANGARRRVLLGAAFGVSSPVLHPSRPWLVDVDLDAGGAVSIDAAVAERAVFIASGSITLDGTIQHENTLVVLDPNVPASIIGQTSSRIFLLGGPPLDGPRYMDWNFVSSSKERIEDAKNRWRAGEFPGVPGDTDFVPYPENHQHHDEH